MFDFIVEDGTGKTDATSYVTVQYVDDYANFLGDTDWAQETTADKETYIIKATMFFDDMLRYKGYLLKEDQALIFPRTVFYDANGRKVEGITDPVKQSVAQLAIESVTDPLVLTEIVLDSQSWGNASETYRGGLVEEESKANVIKKSLLRLGYGASTTSVSTLVRA